MLTFWKAHFHILITCLFTWPLYLMLSMGSSDLVSPVPLVILLLHAFVIYRYDTKWLLLILLLNPAVFLPVRATGKAIMYYTSGQPTRRLCTSQPCKNQLFDDATKVWLEYDNDDCDGEGLNIYDKDIQNALTDWLIKTFGNPIKPEVNFPALITYCDAAVSPDPSDFKGKKQMLDQIRPLTCKIPEADPGGMVYEDSSYVIMLISTTDSDTLSVLFSKRHEKLIKICHCQPLAYTDKCF